LGYTTDDELADGLSRGEPSALDSLFERFLPTLIKSAVSRGFSVPDAEVLAQECLEEAFFKINSFIRGTSLRRWLVGIEVNLMRREWTRRGEVDEVSLEELQEAGRDVSARTLPRLTPGQAQRLGRFWARYQLYRSLIRPKHAAAVELRFLGQLSYGEIARALGLKSEASARVYVQRGLQALKLLEDQKAPEEPWNRPS